MSISPSTKPAPRQAWRWLVVAAPVLLLASAFGYTAGWLTPSRLSAGRIVDALQRNAGVHPGYRRNHAKGICVSGYFESNGAAAPFSTARVFAAGRVPVTGRFAIPGGNPEAADASSPVRSFALRFDLPGGEQWRTGMNNSPVFVVATPQAFYEQVVAAQPDPVTHKPDPERLAAFFAAHPETAPFRAWAKANPPSTSFATQSYYGLNAFYFVDAGARRHPVRWHVEPQTPADTAPASDNLASDLKQRLAQGPLRWRLLITLGAPGDPTNDATRAWPGSRPNVDAGTIVVEHAQDQADGACRDINYDPTVLPPGMALSDDPLLAARASAYADSFRRRTGEEAHHDASPHTTVPRAKAPRATDALEASKR